MAHAQPSLDGDVLMPGTRTDPPGRFDSGRGAEVVMGLTDQPYGSREFAVTDPEGDVWSVGTYRPAAP